MTWRPIIRVRDSSPKATLSAVPIAYYRKSISFCLSHCSPLCNRARPIVYPLLGTTDQFGFIAEGVADSLLFRYRPILVLHPDERSFPASVEWYLQKVSLNCFHEGQGYGVQDKIETVWFPFVQFTEIVLFGMSIGLLSVDLLDFSA